MAWFCVVLACVVFGMQGLNGYGYAVVGMQEFTQADEAQSSRVPVPFPGDPFEAIRQAYLDGIDTESDLFEDPIDTETLELPIAIAPPIPLSESTPPVLVPILCGTVHMAMCTPPAMSSGLSTSMAEVAAMFESALCKRFWSSYESSPYVSPPDLPSRKHYQGTSELVEDSEEDDDEEDEAIEESMDPDSVSEDAKDEGPTIEDEDPTTKDEDPAVEHEGLTAGVKGPGMDDEGYGLDDESHGIDDEGHSVESDGRGLEKREAITEGSGLAPEFGRPERVSVFRNLTLPMDKNPRRTLRTKGFLTELGAQVEMQGGLIHDHAEIFSQRYRFRSVEYERERVARKFGAIWRPVLTLEAWAGQTDIARVQLYGCHLLLWQGERTWIYRSPEEVHRIYEVWISNLVYITKPSSIAPPIPLSESTPPVLVPILCRTAHIAVRIPPAMSSGLSASMAGVAAIPSFAEALLKYVRDEGPTVEDEDPAVEDEDPAVEDKGLITGIDGPGMEDEGYGLDDDSRGIDDEGHSVESDGLGLEEEEEAVPRGQQQTAPVMGTTMSRPLGLGYEALRHQSRRPEKVLAFRQPTLTTWIDLEDATPAAVKTEGFLTKLGAQVEMQGGLIRDHAVRLEELPPALFERYDKEIEELFTSSRAVLGGDFLPDVPVRRMPKEKLSGMPSVMCKESTGIYGYSLLRRDSSRVPVPLPEDPYEAIRQAYLDGTDTESEPFEDPIETETPESPLTIAPPISLSESTPPVLVPILHMTARMVVRVPPAMSSSLSASMAEVHYRGTSELVEDIKKDDDEEDEEINESMDSDSVSDYAEDEGPIAEDEDPAAGDEGHTAGVEGPSMDDESYDLDDKSHGMDDESRGLDDEGHGVKSDGLGLEEDEKAVPGGQQQAASVMRTAVSTPLGLGTTAEHNGTSKVTGEGMFVTVVTSTLSSNITSNKMLLIIYLMLPVGIRIHDIADNDFCVVDISYYCLETGSAPEFERPERVSASRQPTLTTWTDPEDGMVYIDVPAYPPLAPPV
ncbi:hypothetical protein Tco_1053925 [Tanacetum coccineum]|uniref:Uncharacterized protein n=1 Tax=Tanacetum coccineum TaxID=301880 RepID=A0ABQ5GXR2_9ASTR